MAGLLQYTLMTICFHGLGLKGKNEIFFEDVSYC